MSDEKLVQSYQDARLVNLAEHLIFPMLLTQLETRIELMCVDFRSGKSDFIAHVAYITAIKDQISELKLLQSRGNRAYAKLNPET